MTLTQHFCCDCVHFCEVTGWCDAWKRRFHPMLEHDPEKEHCCPHWESYLDRVESGGFIQLTEAERNWVDRDRRNPKLENTF